VGASPVMSVEAAIVSQVDSAELLHLCQELVAVPSFPGEEGSCARLVAARLRELGFEHVELQEVKPGLPNVIATLEGASGSRERSFMLNGHLDIDPLPDDYDKPLFRTWVEGDLLWGTGLANMKAGLASMIGAALAIKRSGVRLERDLVVACVVGELAGGFGTQHYLEHNPVPAWAIVPEPTDANVRTVHAGCLQLLIHVRGGDAVQRTMRALGALEQVDWSCGSHPLAAGLPRLCVGGVVGGVGASGDLASSGRPPDRATLLVDVRTAPQQSMDDAIGDLRRTLDRVHGEDPGFDYEIDGPPAAYVQFGANECFQPPLDLSPADPLATLTARWHERLTGTTTRVGFQDPGSFAGADTGWLFSKGCRAINYGPMAAAVHHDHVRLERLTSAAQVMAMVAAELCMAPGSTNA
jgi:acetylornithine deacetylase